MLTPPEFTCSSGGGMDVYDSVFACPSCGVAMDRAGYHALTCRHAGSLGVRHNALREIFLDFLCRAGIGATREVPSLLPGSAARPVGIFVPNFAAALPACLDFAVTHTQQPNIFNVRVCVAARRQSSMKLLSIRNEPKLMRARHWNEDLNMSPEL